MQANMVDMQIPDKVQGIPYGGMGGCDTFHSARIPRQRREKNESLRLLRSRRSDDSMMMIHSQES